MFRAILYSLLIVSSGFAAGELLVSNYSFATGGIEKGKLWVFSRGDANGGFSLLEFGDGNPLRVLSGEFSVFENEVEQTSVHDGILSDALAERRRTPFVNAGKLGFVLPMFEPDSTGLFRKPSGFVSIRGVEEGGLSYISLQDPQMEYTDTVPSLMDGALSGFAYDSFSQVLFMARGTSGLLRYDFSKGLGNAKEVTLIFNKKEKRLDTLQYGQKISLKNFPAILDVTLDAKENLLWLATTNGLFVQESSSSPKFKSISGLDSLRITGVWCNPNSTQIIAESAKQSKGRLDNKLFRSLDKKTFKEVVFRDTTGKEISKVYDGADYSVSNVVFIGDKAFVAVRAVGGSESGLIKLDEKGAVPWDSEENQWLYGLEAGVIDRNTMILSVGEWVLPNGGVGLSVATYGNGISVSADSGKTWQTVLNQAPVGKNLSFIRMVPSVIAADGESLVAYNLSKESRVTIEVFSYDMRKVRTIVKDAMRPASAARSTNASEDLWDGRDDMGRAVTMGIYYVRVKDNHGHVGWGKVMTLGGR